MTRVASTEITKDGTVVAVSTPDSSYLNGILPSLYSSVFSFEKEVNDLIKEHISNVFDSNCPTEFSLIVNGQSIQITAHRYQDDKAFLYWKKL